TRDDVAVDGDGAARVEAIGPSCTEDDDRGKDQATHSPQAIDEEKSDDPADEAEAEVPRESTRESCHSRLGCASGLSLNAGRIRAATGTRSETHVLFRAGPLPYPGGEVVETLQKSLLSSATVFFGRGHAPDPGVPNPSLAREIPWG